MNKQATAELTIRRTIVKLSGEALSGNGGGSGIDPATLKATAEELAEVHAQGVQIGIVVGGGNIFRGLGGASLIALNLREMHAGQIGQALLCQSPCFAKLSESFRERHIVHYP